MLFHKSAIQKNFSDLILVQKTQKKRGGFHKKEEHLHFPEKKILNKNLITNKKEVSKDKKANKNDSIRKITFQKTKIFRPFLFFLVVKFF